MKMEKSRQLATQFFSIMYRMRLLTKKAHFAKEIPPAEFFMIMAISKRTEHGEDKKKLGITVTELVEELGTTLPAGSKLLRSIERKGLVDRVRDKNDRRVTYLRLSAKGLILLNEQIQARDKMMENIVLKMGEDNMKMLLTQLQNLYDIVKEEMEDK